MARKIWLLLVAASLFTLVSLTSANPPEERDDKANLLKMQMARIRAKSYLRDQQAAKAVELLEEHLAYIRGDQEYLLLLRDAYRAYLPQLNSQPELAQVYRNRLGIIENGSQQESVKQPVVQEQITSALPTQPVALPTDPKDKLSPPPGLELPGTPRAKPDMEEPFQSKLQAGTTGQIQASAQALLTRAESAFEQKNYLEARSLFEQAHRNDPAAVEPARGRWAYTKLFYVTEQTKKQPLQGVTWTELETEVKSAMSLAPHLEKTGQYVLEELQKRRGPGAAAAATATVQVTHLARTPQGWEVAETPAFRIFHKQGRDYAEQAARVAEQTRREMSRKWFGNDGEIWNPKCDVYLHPTTQDYMAMNPKVAPNSPGHSAVESDRSSYRIVSRKIHLRCDNPTTLTAVLPHEATHVVIAGQYGPQPVPRWADEGVAVLTEPADKVEAHRKNLWQFAQKRELFSVQELLQLDDYPQPARIGAFYAQSVSVVDFLCKQKDPQTFTAFLRDGLKEGYEAAARKHFGFRNYAEFQERWWAHVSAEMNPATAAGVTRR